MNRSGTASYKPVPNPRKWDNVMFFGIKFFFGGHFFGGKFEDKEQSDQPHSTTNILKKKNKTRKKKKMKRKTSPSRLLDLQSFIIIIFFFLRWWGFSSLSPFCVWVCVCGEFRFLILFGLFFNSLVDRSITYTHDHLL